MRWVLSIALAILVFPAGVWAFRFAKEVIGVPREAYASDWTAAFIIDHIRTSGAWPTGWDDLHDEYDRLAVPQHYAWTFDELQTLIDVNWDSSIDAIRESDVPHDNVQLTSGRQVSYNGDPDVLIHDFVHTGSDPHQIRRRIGEVGEPSDAPESANVGVSKIEDQPRGPGDR
ncbi:hypothetical protein FYK55_28190 [Roseiconus nitratireducens]|uniref:Uncharacterized protein n=1 Tax=Roseiconus nitratireducens TaxID=2605748 RepID=A0A5M6CM61_9BACT|nr:hypothetical protein [Roseiconus nitratireducens]KAA5536077.1 hypothetical protein FYK55_28190 [Roseiconus nitratireducens]